MFAAANVTTPGQYLATRAAGLRETKAVRRRVLVMGAAQVAAASFRSLMPADGKPAYTRQKGLPGRPFGLTGDRSDRQLLSGSGVMNASGITR